MENEAITPESVAAAVEAAKAAQAAEAPVEEVKVEEAPVEEVKVEEAPVVEETPVAVEETPAVEVPVEEPAAVEAPVEAVTPEVPTEEVVETVEANAPENSDILNSDEITNILKEEGVEPEVPTEETVEVPTEEVVTEEVVSEEAPVVKKDSYQDKIEKIDAKISKHKADIEELEAQKELLIKEQLATDVKGKIDNLSLEELEKLKDELK